MTGTIQFQYDEENDVVIVTPHWKIETKEDCEAWFKQYVDYFGVFHRKVDAVFVLDDFVVASQIVTVWSEYRVRLMKSFIRFSYRVNSNSLVNIMVKSSSFRYNAISQDADSVEGAIEGIKAERLGVAASA
ncbi:MAG: hypothetical protein PHU06_04055 [Gallionella sp.]|nr:hypothetical protein [Gallionella sp.]MDD4958685.1 hypothetical protein [Gallionella sp.]